jgi:hypothetical protein
MHVWLQKDFHIGSEGSFILQIKNPENQPPGRPGLAEKAEYSEEKRGEFKGYAWIPVGRGGEGEGEGEGQGLRGTQCLCFCRCVCG